MDTTEIEFMMNAQISTKTNNVCTSATPFAIFFQGGFRGGWFHTLEQVDFNDQWLHQQTKQLLWSFNFACLSLMSQFPSEINMENNQWKLTKVTPLDLGKTAILWHFLRTWVWKFRISVGFWNPFSHQFYIYSLLEMSGSCSTLRHLHFWFIQWYYRVKNASNNSLNIHLHYVNVSVYNMHTEILIYLYIIREAHHVLVGSLGWKTLFYFWQ